MTSHDFSTGPHFDPENSPFDPATGKLTRLFKGGSSSAPPQIPQSAAAAETPTLVGQARQDDLLKEQRRRGRNRSVIGASGDESFGNRLTMG